MSEPTADAVAHARDDYRRALEVLMADHKASELRAKRAAVGHCFKAIERLADDSTRMWPVYLAATALDDDGRLSGWHFQHTANDEVQIREEPDLQAGFLMERCTEVERVEFVAAFNEVLTYIARYASRIPFP